MGEILRLPRQLIVQITCTLKSDDRTDDELRALALRGVNLSIEFGGLLPAVAIAVVPVHGTAPPLPGGQPQ